MVSNIEYKDFCIATLNCHGFRKRLKRYTVYKQARHLKIDFFVATRNLFI